MKHLRKEGSTDSHVCLCMWSRGTCPSIVKHWVTSLMTQWLNVPCSLDYDCVTHQAESVWKNKFASEYKHLGVTGLAASVNMMFSCAF